jgi:hypothetical protein
MDLSMLLKQNSSDEQQSQQSAVGLSQNSPLTAQKLLLYSMLSMNSDPEISHLISSVLLRWKKTR